MRRSEIFDEFVKIAEENNIVSSDKSFDKLEKNPRADSLSISDIEKLYNVKPDSKLKYKNNIMESAHPESSVASSAYDKLNGLVENNIERQNILLNIVNKNNNGHLTQHKYAKKELLLSLVKIANDLDNKNQDELRSLADVCIEQISSKSLKKQAMDPMTIALIVGGITGAAALKYYLPNFNTGFKENHKDLVKQLEDLINSNDVTLGFGRKLKPEFIQDMRTFKNLLSNFYNIYSRLAPNISKINAPKTTDEKIQLAKVVADGKDNVTKNIIKNKEMLVKLMDNMEPYFEKVSENFKNDIYKELQTEDIGFFTSLTDFLGVNDFKDVIKAIEPYKKSLEQLREYINNSIQAEQNVIAQFKQEIPQGEVTEEEIDSLLNRSEKPKVKTTPVSFPAQSVSSEPKGSTV